MTLYELFGVPEDAGEEELDAAWKRLMKLYHPDLNPIADQRVAQEINAAHDFLKDPQKRAAYDARLAWSRRPAPVFSFTVRTSSSSMVAVGDVICVNVTGPWNQA